MKLICKIFKVLRQVISNFENSFEVYNDRKIEKVF